MTPTLSYQQMGTQARSQAHALFAQTMAYVAATAGLFALGAWLGHSLTGGAGIVAFIAAFAALIGMRFAAKRSVPLTVALLAGDGGIDVWVPGATGVQIFQIKSYTGNIDRARQRHIRESWEALMGYLEPRSITVDGWALVLPENLTIQQDEWLQDLTKEASFPRTWHGIDYLDGLAAKYPDVIDYYLRDGKERLERVVQQYLSLAGLRNPLPSPAESTQTLAEIHRALNEFDPHYYYDYSVDTLTAEQDCPPVPNTPRLVAAYQTTDGTSCIMFKIIARFNEALKERPVPGSMTLIAVEGSDTQARIEDWINYGAPLENIPAQDIHVDLPGGFETHLETGLVSTRPEGPVTGIGSEITLRVLEPGGAAVASLDFVAEEQTTGLERTRLRNTGHDKSASVLKYELRWDSQDKTGTINLSLEDLTGKSPADVLPVLGFLGEVRPPYSLQAFLRNGPALSQPSAVGGEILPRQTGELLIKACEALATIQEHVFQSIQIPDLATTTWDMLEAWIEVASLLRGEQLSGTWSELKAHLRPGVDPPAEPGSLANAAPMSIRVGDTFYPVGTVILQAAAAKVDTTRAPEPHDDHVDVWFVPADTDVVTKRLVPPGQGTLDPNAY